MRLHEHSAKPAPRFYGKDDYFLGIELEMEAPDRAAHEAGLNASRRPGYMYAKHDGSLNQYGFELVTHPISRGFWLSTGRRTPVRRFLDHVALCRDTLNYNSHNGGRCGLHIHISWSAFRGMGTRPGIERRYCTHLYWFKKLVVTDDFLKLSQRARESLNQWARPNEVCVTNFSERSSNRYMAINHTPATCEIRIFRGNMREERIRKAVEAVIAGIEYTRTLSSKDYEKPIYVGFSEYVVSKAKKYPNLHAYMVEIGQIQRAEDSAREFVRGGDTEQLVLQGASSCA